MQTMLPGGPQRIGAWCPTGVLGILLGLRWCHLRWLALPPVSPFTTHTGVRFKGASQCPFAVSALGRSAWHCSFASALTADACAWTNLLGRLKPGSGRLAATAQRAAQEEAPSRLGGREPARQGAWQSEAFVAEGRGGRRPVNRCTSPSGPPFCSAPCALRPKPMWRTGRRSTSASRRALPQRRSGRRAPRSA